MLVAAQQDRVLAGLNAFGGLGDGTSLPRNVPTAVSTGTVSLWRATSAGENFMCGLAADSGKDGKAYCWGEPAARPAMSPTQRQVQ